MLLFLHRQTRISTMIKSIGLIAALFLCTLTLPAQNVVHRPLSYGDRIHGYVLCNGKCVDAVYSVRDIEGTQVELGCNSYSQTAVDTALAGRIVVPLRITAPNGQSFLVTSASRHCFAHCSHITEVVLSDSIRDIGDQSFMNCRSLKSVELPSGATNLWPYAFRGCSKLRRVIVKATVPPDSYNDVFDEHTLRFATLVVPLASAEAYRQAFVWNMFRYSIPSIDL